MKICAFRWRFMVLYGVVGLFIYIILFILGVIKTGGQTYGKTEKIIPAWQILVLCPQR